MVYRTKIKYLKAFFCLFFLVLPIFIHADTSSSGLVPCGNEGEDACTLNDLLYTLIPNVIQYILYTIVPILAVLWFVFAGFKMMTSSGDPAKFKEGKNMLIYGAVGIILVFSAYIIVETFLKLIGADSWVYEFMEKSE
ncbi:MAG: pilin [Candidatus Pacebacteria bacterium]|nr:pilin [Candidatus Paceibacterota bacterium]